MRGKWKKHQKDMLFEVEKARFPETMPAVENVLEVKEWKRVNAEEHNKIFELEQKIRELKRSREIRERNIERALNGETIEKEGEEKNKYQRACPNNECNGSYHHSGSVVYVIFGYVKIVLKLKEIQKMPNILVIQTHY